MQHQHTAKTVTSFSAQPNDASSSEVSYQTLPSFPHPGPSASTPNKALKQEPGECSGYDDGNTFGTQFYGGSERPQFDGLDTSPLAGTTDPFAGLNLGYSSYLNPEDAMDNFDAFNDGFTRY